MNYKGKLTVSEFIILLGIWTQKDLTVDIARAAVDRGVGGQISAWGYGAGHGVYPRKSGLGSSAVD